MFDYCKILEYIFMSLIGGCEAVRVRKSYPKHSSASGRRKHPLTHNQQSYKVSISRALSPPS